MVINVYDGNSFGPLIKWWQRRCRHIEARGKGQGHEAREEDEDTIRRSQESGKLSWAPLFLKMIIIVHQEHNHNVDEKESIDYPHNNIKAI